MPEQKSGFRKFVDYVVLEQTIPLLVAMGSLVMISVNLSTDSYTKQFRQLERKVAAIEDTNHDGMDMNEWARVYKKLGISFDAKSPKSLTTSDLETYLSTIHSDSK